MSEEPRESLHLRVPKALKKRVSARARELGVPINAAALMLLDEALQVVEAKRAER